MDDLSRAVETMVNLIYLIEQNAGNEADVRRLTELARTPMLILIACATEEETRVKKSA